MRVPAHSFKLNFFKSTDGMPALISSLRRFIAIGIFLVSSVAHADPLVMAPMTVAVQAQSDDRLEYFIERSLTDAAVIYQEHAVLSSKHSEAEIADPALFSNTQFIVASAPIYALLERYGGFTAIASIVPQEAINADSASSTVVLVRKPPADEIVTLKSLKGKTLALLGSDAIETRMQLADELISQRHNADAFFEVTEFDGSPSSLISALKSGTFDAVAVASHVLRDLPPESLIGLQVVEPRLNLELNLPHTTSVYPGWVFAASFKTSRDFADNLGALLRSLPAREGFSWTRAADYRKIHQVLQRTDDALYKSLQRRSVGDILMQYSAWILLVIVILLGLALHSVLAERLVQRRTRELDEMHRKQKEAQTRYEHLEKASIVGQMSNLVAHELRQPLAAITNYTMGARRRLKNGMLDDESLSFALERTLQESRRANAIVEHVQGYAKQKKRNCSRLNLNELLACIAAQYTDSQGKPRIRLELQENLTVLADPLEIELCVKNLIKNAFEAGLAAHNPIIELSASRDLEGTLRIRVSDRGFALNDEAFSALTMPFASSKPDGLGLGLAIVRKIIESYAGHLEFERVEPQGLAVTIVLPSEAAVEEVSS